jgi:hypothetical protein
MKTWIGAATLAALAAVGSVGTIDVASAAEVINVPQRARSAAAPGLHSQRTYRHDRYADRRYDQPFGGWTYYYGRPYLYIPAPFPLGFDFGFGW